MLFHPFGPVLQASRMEVSQVKKAISGSTFTCRRSAASTEMPHSHSTASSLSALAAAATSLDVARQLDRRFQFFERCFLTNF
jgi:hypothetical protein